MSGMPYRYRNFQQFVPESDTLNPSTWSFLRGLAFTDQSPGWYMSFKEGHHIVSSSELLCECEESGMRCKCAAGVSNFTYLPPEVNETVTVITDFQYFDDGMNNGIEDDLEGATPLRGRYVSQRGWTEVASLSCSKCLSQLDTIGPPEILSKVCSAMFLSTCQSLEGQVRWPICSYCVSDDMGGGLNTTNIAPETTHYNEIKVSGRYDIYTIQEWLYSDVPSSTEMEYTMHYKKAKMAWRDSVVLGMRDAILQTHVEIMTLAAELAAKQDRWAGYNYTRGGFNDNTELLKERKVTTYSNVRDKAYQRTQGQFADVDLLAVSRTFCDMIFTSYVTWFETNGPDEAKKTRLDVLGPYEDYPGNDCSFCDMAYVDETGEWSDDTRWACDFCITNRIVDDDAVGRGDKCIEYSTLHTRPAYAKLEKILGFEQGVLQPDITGDIQTDTFPVFNADNQLLRLESDIVGFWRWCDSDDHMTYIYQDYFLNNPSSTYRIDPWSFTTADACEQSRFSFNPIPNFNLGDGMFEANPKVPVNYKKWWGLEEVEENYQEPDSWWYGWYEGRTSEDTPNDGQTLENSLTSFNQLFWGVDTGQLAQGLDPTEAQAMTREDFMVESTLFDIDMMWYGFPHNPWRCFEYEDMVEATLEEFERVLTWESNYQIRSELYYYVKVYWCGVCDAEVFCSTETEGTSQCECEGGLTDDLEPYGFEPHCNPYVYYVPYTHPEDYYPAWPANYSDMGEEEAEAGGYTAMVESLKQQDSYWKKVAASKLVYIYNRTLCPQTTPLALDTRTRNGFNILNISCQDTPISIQSHYQSQYAPSRDEMTQHCCWERKIRDDPLYEGGACAG